MKNLESCLFENPHTGIFVLDSQGRILRFNLKIKTWQEQNLWPSDFKVGDPLHGLESSEWKPLAEISLSQPSRFARGSWHYDITPSENQTNHTSVFFVSLSENPVPIPSNQNETLDLKLELQMTDIALERKVYELSMIRGLLAQIKRIQDYDEILFLFMRFLCEKFLLGHGYFIKLFAGEDWRGHVSSSYSLQESPNLSGLRQRIHETIHSHSELFLGPLKYWTKNIPEVLESYFAIPNKKLTGVLHIPIVHNTKVLGALHLGHYSPHHGMTQQDLDFIHVLLEQIEPFIENSKLFELSMVDDLTQVFNKRFFKITMEREFKRGKENPDAPMSLVMLDIDFFKRVNDTYGHLGGDKVLQAFSQILKTSTRDKDIVCRYGGEEFAILMLEPIEVALKLAERIREKLRMTDIDVAQNSKIKVTSSLGICSFDSGMRSVEDWVDRADQSLYQAKKTGRDRIVLDPESERKKAS